jgi:hypothetical protein
LHEVDQRPTVAGLRPFVISQKPCFADRLLTAFDQPSIVFDQRSIVDRLTIPVQDKSCPYRDPAGARSLHDNILVRLRPTPETITR